MTSQPPGSSTWWGNGVAHGLAVRFIGINYKGSMTSRCILLSLQTLLFLGLLVTGFVLYATSSYWSLKSYPIIYTYNTNEGISHSRFLDWNSALALGVLGAIGLAGIIWEWFSTCTNIVHPTERVNSRWSAIVIDSFITPTLVVTLLTEVGDLQLWNLIGLFFLHHVATLLNYSIEYDGQTRTSAMRLLYDKRISAFVSLVAALPIMFAWPVLSTLNNTVIAAASLTLIYGIADVVINYMYASSLQLTVMKGAEWLKRANGQSRRAMQEQADMDVSGSLIASETAPNIDDDKEECHGVDPVAPKSITSYYRYYMIKNTVSPVFKFTVALLLLLAPVLDTSARRQEMSRIYTSLCESDQPPSSWNEYGYAKDSCMLNGVLCNYLGDMATSAGFNSYNYDLMFNRNPFQTYGVSAAALINVDSLYPRSLQQSTAWTSVFNNRNTDPTNPAVGTRGLIYGNSTPFFMCAGTPVSACDGVSKCPGIGWSEDRRSVSSLSRDKFGVVSLSGPMPPAPVIASYTMTPTPTPADQNKLRQSYLPINCDDPDLADYVGTQGAFGAVCIEGGWVSPSACVAAPCPSGKKIIKAGNPSEGWIDGTCTFDIRCSTGPAPSNY